MSEAMITQTESTILSEGYAKAVKLDQQIESYLCMAVQNTIVACRYIAEMKESGLYTELGYKDFDDYIEKRHNIKSRQAYKYISIAKNIPEDLLSPGAKIGMSQLYLLSTLTIEEQKQVVEETDLESTTKREMEQKVKEMKLLRKDLERAEAECDTLTKDCDQLKLDLNDAARDIDKLQKQNDKLSREVEKLENRPIEVAVKDNDEELEKLREAVKAAEKEKADLDKKYKERMNELLELDKQHKAEVEKISAEYEAKLKEAENTAETSQSKPTTETVSDPKEGFKAYYTMAYKAFSALLTFSKDQSEEYKELFLGKVSQLADSLKESAKNTEKE